jgi:hypothetical protein
VCDLLQLASPIATIIAAGVVVYFTRQLGKGQLAVATRQADIAAQQARLADVRLQHDLFDRRFEIYEAARNLLLDVSDITTPHMKRLAISFERPKKRPSSSTRE